MKNPFVDAASRLFAVQGLFAFDLNDGYQQLKLYATCGGIRLRLRCVLTVRFPLTFGFNVRGILSLQRRAKLCNFMILEVLPGVHQGLQ